MNQAADMGDRPKYVRGDIDRQGKARWRFRKPGMPSVTLPGPFKSPEFWAAYAAAMAGEPLGDELADKPVPARPGSFRAACQSYFVTPEFRRLDPETQRVR